MEPFLISNYKGKIYNTDLKSFKNKKNLNSMNDSEIFLVSTMESFSEKLKSNNLFFKKLNNEYSIEIIKEITTNITRSYNNSCCETTGKNNFYLYKLTKK